jgi:hypothetical protein
MKLTAALAPKSTKAAHLKALLDSKPADEVFTLKDLGIINRNSTHFAESMPDNAEKIPGHAADRWVFGSTKAIAALRKLKRKTP